MTDPVPPARAASAPRARPVLVVGVLSAGAAAAMAAVVPLARPVLAALLLVLQCAFVVAWSYALDTPEVVGAIAVSAGAAAASDGLLLSDEHVTLTDFATIVALAFLLAIVWQLVRRNRTRVTESLATALAATVVAVAGGAYLTLRAGVGGHVSAAAGRQATTVTLLGVACVLGVGRLVDAWWPRPALTGSRRRGLVGLVAGLAVAGVVGAVYGGHVAGSTAAGVAGQHLGSGTGALVALAAAAVAALTDLGVEAGLATLAADAAGPSRPASADPAPTSGPASGEPLSADALSADALPDALPAERPSAEPASADRARAGRRRTPWPARLVVVAVLPVLMAAPAGYVVARVMLT